MNSYRVISACTSLHRAQNLLLRHQACHRSIVVSRFEAQITRNRRKRRFATTTRCGQVPHLESASSSPHDFLPVDLKRTRAPTDALENSRIFKLGLPQTCPGCGALTQESTPDEAGYYSRSRRAIKEYLRKQRAVLRRQVSAVSEAHDPEHGPKAGLVDASIKVNEVDGVDGLDEVDEVDEVDEMDEANDTSATKDAESVAAPITLATPLCDRCHSLIHDSRGKSIAHPSLDALADSIAESPFNRNHVYHVVDAADFPMSVVPDIFSKLILARPRSQNRRSQHDFSTKPTVSFIITRSDLLGSTKEMVDSMMMFFQTVLRTVLGRAGKDMRLGNVHLVSAKRGWWTKELKEDIWKRGGGNWMLGKVNVGKSNLFEVLFPKGSADRAPVYAELRAKQEKEDQHATDGSDIAEENMLDLLSETSLLPPPQPESPFPVFPIVSSLPGTTASPIRLPFGNHKGELVDLPGLERGDLEKYVKPEHRLDLVMTHRQNIEQHIIRPGQSLILGGGLIRITPQLDAADRSTTMLAYSFVPLEPHITSTEKATGQQLQQRKSGIDTILADSVGEHMASAGVIELSTDVTKVRAGSLLRSGVDISKLPFRVYATDILIEGLGWIELVCQVRRRAMPQPVKESVTFAQVQDATEQTEQTEQTQDGFAPFGKETAGPAQEKQSLYPLVEVFSPKGKHVSHRQSLQAWMRWNEGRKTKKGFSKPKKPRRAMVGR